MMRLYQTMAALTVVLLACYAENEAASSVQPDYISFHWPASQPDADARTCVLLTTGEAIALDPEKIIGTEHFLRAFVSGADDFVTVVLSDAGRSILAEATKGRKGDRLAIVVTDTVVAMPTLSGELDVAEIPLMPQRSSADAQRFATRLNEAIAARQASEAFEP